MDLMLTPNLQPNTKLNHQKCLGWVCPYVKLKVKPEKDKSTEKQMLRATC